MKKGNTVFGESIDYSWNRVCSICAMVEIVAPRLLSSLPAAHSYVQMAESAIEATPSLISVMPCILRHWHSCKQKGQYISIIEACQREGMAGRRFKEVREKEQ